MTEAHPGPSLGLHSSPQTDTTPPSSQLELQGSSTPRQQGLGKVRGYQLRNVVPLGGTEACRAHPPKSHLPSLPTAGTEALERLQPTAETLHHLTHTHRPWGGPGWAPVSEGCNLGNIFSPPFSSCFPLMLYHENVHTQKS